MRALDGRQLETQDACEARAISETIAGQAQPAQSQQSIPSRQPASSQPQSQPPAPTQAPRKRSRAAKAPYMPRVGSANWALLVALLKVRVAVSLSHITITPTTGPSQRPGQHGQGGAHRRSRSIGAGDRPHPRRWGCASVGRRRARGWTRGRPWWRLPVQWVEQHVKHGQPRSATRAAL